MGQRIAVLGAGPMGLAVAYQLALDGHQPVLFEADDRVGGMTATFDFGGLEIERYYHFHCISDHAFLKALEELGIADRMRWVETRMGYWYQGCLQSWGNPMALLKFRGLSFVAKFRYGLHAFLSTKRNDWRPLDNVEASGWIRRWVGEEAWEVLWRRLFDYKFYEYAKGLSAAWIWSRIRRIGRSRYSLFREKLGYLEGGSRTLLQALKAAIEAHGGEVRLSSPVEKVVIEGGKVAGVQIAGQLELFDKVISTVTVADCVLIFVLATLFGAATMSPGGLGAMEAALVYQMIGRGVDDGVAVSLAIAIRLVTLWLGMMLGGVSLLISNKFPTVNDQVIQKGCL